MSTPQNYWLTLSENPQFVGKFKLLEEQLDNGCSLELAINNAGISQQDLEQFLMVLQASMANGADNKNVFKQKLQQQQQQLMGTVSQGLRQFMQQHY